MIKKVLLMGTFLLGIASMPNLQAQGNCEPQCPADQPVGECYCKYVHYTPKCNYTKRCVEECVPCTRRCCRQVPEYYDVQRCQYRCEKYCVPVQKCRYVPEYYTVNVERCRQVPEYYTEQKCRYKCEYYDVPDCKTCKKYICEPNYTYCQSYYWKRECCNGNGY